MRSTLGPNHGREAGPYAFGALPHRARHEVAQHDQRQRVDRAIRGIGASSKRYQPARLGTSRLVVLPERMAERRPAVDMVPERHRLERLDPGGQRVSERRAVGRTGRPCGRPRSVKSKPRAGASNTGSRQVPSTAPDGRTSARRCDIERPRRQCLDLDVDRAVRHLGDERGVQRPELLHRVLENSACIALDRERRDHAALGQRTQVPPLVDRTDVVAVVGPRDLRALLEEAPTRAERSRRTNDASIGIRHARHGSALIRAPPTLGLTAILGTCPSPTRTSRTCSAHRWSRAAPSRSPASTETAAVPPDPRISAATRSVRW